MLSRDQRWGKHLELTTFVWFLPSSRHIAVDHPTQNTLGSPPGHFKPPSLHGQHCQTKTRKVLEHGHFLRVFGRGLYWTMFPCWVCVECFSMGQKGKNGSPLHPREVPDLQKIWIRCQVSRQGNICGLVIPQAVHSWRSTRSTRSAAKNLQHFPRSPSDKRCYPHFRKPPWWLVGSSYYFQFSNPTFNPRHEWREVNEVPKTCVLIPSGGEK